MTCSRLSVLLASTLLAGCAAGDGLDGQRTVFSNPLAPPVIDRRGVGPQCDVEFGRDATCLGTPLAYPGEGRRVLLGDGEMHRLTRNQARILRQRAELLEARRNAMPSPPPPPPPPPMSAVADEQR